MTPKKTKKKHKKKTALLGLLSGKPQKPVVVGKPFTLLLIVA